MNIQVPASCINLLRGLEDNNEIEWVNGLGASGGLNVGQTKAVAISHRGSPVQYIFLFQTYGVAYLTDNRPMVARSDVIFICVKPHLVQTVLRECEDVITGQLIVSIAAGVTIEDLEGVSVPTWMIKCSGCDMNQNLKGLA